MAPPTPIIMPSSLRTSGRSSSVGSSISDDGCYFLYEKAKSLAPAEDSTQAVNGQHWIRASRSLLVSLLLTLEQSLKTSLLPR